MYKIRDNMSWKDMVLEMLLTTFIFAILWGIYFFSILGICIYPKPGMNTFCALGTQVIGFILASCTAVFLLRSVIIKVNFHPKVLIGLLYFVLVVFSTIVYIDILIVDLI